LWFYFAREEGKRYRALGWMYVVTLAIFVVAKARFYYLAPMYPVLLAAGSVLWGKWVSSLRPAGARGAQAALWTAMAAGAVIFALMTMPLAPFGSGLWKFTSKVHDQFREEIGWTDLAQTVARVYQSLPAEEQARTGILTGNYGEGGALNLYGPALGLPRAMAGTNSFWYRGYAEPPPETVIVVGFDLDEAEEHFSSCRVAAKNTNAYNVVNEESRDHPNILVCRHLRESWPEFWRRFRRFG
jgi:hypothetical protein